MTRITKKLMLTASLASLLMALPGCEVGPDYEKPDTQLPANWISAPTEQQKTDAANQEWWNNFHDPVLTAFIQKAVSGNLDLQIAETRIASARAQRSSAFATLLPTGNIKGEAERAAIPTSFGSFPGISNPTNVYEGEFDASWELDVFGGHKRDLEGAEAALEGAEASKGHAMVSLMAEVARTYIDIRQYQAQMSIADDTVHSDEQSASIARQRFNAGQSARVDLTQAEAQLEQAKAQIPYYRNKLGQSEFTMDVLIGEQPGVTRAMVEPPMPIPFTNKEVVLSAPARVIADRPDIKVAERKVASATAGQGSALAKFFPDISLSGFYGVFATNAGDLLMKSSTAWMGGGSIVWPILNYPSLQANLDNANALQQEALVEYRKSILMALADVEKSLDAYTQQDKYRQALVRTVEADSHYAEISRERYKEGMTSFLEVTDAERALYTAQSQLTEANAVTSQDLVAVYKSLGGGWHE